MRFQSGAKSSEEAPRYDLIPREALVREAARFALGAAHHGEGNYQRGAGDAAFVRDRINHLLGHALAYANGDRSEDHLGAVRCNAAMLIWLEEHDVPVPAVSVGAPAPAVAPAAPPDRDATPRHRAVADPSGDPYGAVS